MFMIPVDLSAVSVQMGGWFGQDWVIALSAVIVASFVAGWVVAALRSFVQ